MGFVFSLIASCVSAVLKIFTVVAIKTKLWIVVVVYFAGWLFFRDTFSIPNSPAHGNAVILGGILWIAAWTWHFKKQKKQENTEDETYIEEEYFTGGDDNYEK